MDAKSFRRLCATLGSLTGPQLKELWTALRSLDARMQAIGAIEKRREGAVACPHCSHDRSTRWGSTRTGVQRMRCPSCRRTFSSSTGTAVARIHSPARFHQVVADMFCDHPRSCRGLGRALGLDKMTIWRWRQKIIRALGGSGASNLGGVVEADEKFFRESRKGSREWVRHQRDPINHPKPDRMRWVDYKRTRTKLPAGISKYQIPVLTMADRAGARRADVLPDHSAPPLMAVLARCLRSDAVRGRNSAHSARPVAKTRVAPRATPLKSATTEATRRIHRRFSPPASDESAAKPVNVRVKTVVVKSATPRQRTVAFRTPIAAPVKTMRVYSFHVGAKLSR